ncbi:MAG: ribonuclease HII [Desulfuromonadaceae bacterium]|nr:ribonuclease HII [Desulfuromonadaceae bacterium]
MVKQRELFSSTSIDTLKFEKAAYRNYFKYVAGVDEAGRGPLAGPVIAAAVILPENLLLPGVDDSKKLSSSKREKLFDVIKDHAVSIGVGVVTASEIDKINILQATRLAMLSAVQQLSPEPDYLLIDGNCKIETLLQQKTIIKGDSLSISIAAASIIAKVTRDRYMTEMDSTFPGYGFSAHKGYGSAVHMERIRVLGPSPIHRLSFAGVKEHIRCTSF